MSKVVQVRELAIGEGRPKICVPFMGKTEEQIAASAGRVLDAGADLAEWRADYFEGLLCPERMKAMLGTLRARLGGMPLLFTIRTRAEGGEAELSFEDYTRVNLDAAASGCVDLIDVEIDRGDDVAFLVVEGAHEHGVQVIGSYHDFQKTPKKEDLIMRLCKMQEAEADIAKIAVMPQSPRDVLVLLDATLAMKELHDETPVVTMAMGDLGKVTRVSGEVFGSAITFGMAGNASAPGQMPVKELEACLKCLETNGFVDEK